MYCPKCGSLMKQGAKFCGKCGATIAKATAPQERETANLCPSCSAPLRPGKHFCGVCGQRLDLAVKPPDAAKANEPSQVMPTVLPPQIPVPPQVRREPQPAPRIPIPPPQAPPPPPPRQEFVQQSYEEGLAAPKGGRGALWIGIGVTGVVVLVLGAFFGYKLLAGDSFGKRIDAALAQDRIFSPSGDCVADIVAAERAKHPQSPKLAEAAPKIKAKVWAVVSDAFQGWYKDSDNTASWDDLEKDCALLESLYPQDNDISAFHAYTRAQKAVALKDFNQARTSYEEAVTKKPNWALALNGLGKVYARDDSPLKNEAHALDYYQKAIQADPNFTWAYVNLSSYYRGKHDLPVAKDYMAKALAIYPSNSSILRRMGDICFEMNDRRQALDYYQKALANETDPSVQESLRKAIAGAETDILPPKIPDWTDSGANRKPRIGMFVPSNELDGPPTPIQTVTPKYTPDAILNQISGSVTLSLDIDEGGKVTKAGVVSGPTPDYGMRSSCQQAASSMTFSPPTKKGVPVKTTWTFMMALSPPAPPPPPTEKLSSLSVIIQAKANIDAFQLLIDKQVVWESSLIGGFGKIKQTSKEFNLTPGSHSLELRKRVLASEGPRYLSLSSGTYNAAAGEKHVVKLYVTIFGNAKWQVVQ